MSIEDTLKEFANSLAVTRGQVWWQSMVLLEPAVEGMSWFKVSFVRFLRRAGQQNTERFAEKWVVDPYQGLRPQCCFSTSLETKC